MFWSPDLYLNSLTAYTYRHSKIIKLMTLFGFGNKNNFFFLSSFVSRKQVCFFLYLTNET